MKVRTRRVPALAVLLAATSVTAPAMAQGWQPNTGHSQIPIWSGRIPNALPVSGPEKVTKNTTSLVAGKSWLWVTNVSRPTITVYPPTSKRTGAAVLVFPGGGYKILAMDLEGTEICDWLTSKGITAVLVKYRVPTPKVGDYGESVQALQDAQRALSLVRFRASDLHVDPHKIGVIGFSAGGHLVAALSTRYDHRSYSSQDTIDKASCRPDFGIALYPGHLSSWYPDEPKSHVNPTDLALNPKITVTKRTPPTFLVQAENDPVDDVRNSLSYYLALKNAKVPAELHLYAEGGHAYGLRPTSKPITQWPSLVEKWLRTIRMIP
jgi:acetyl esterase/lipase